MTATNLTPLIQRTRGRASGNRFRVLAFCAALLALWAPVSAASAQDWSIEQRSGDVFYIDTKQDDLRGMYFGYALTNGSGQDWTNVRASLALSPGNITLAENGLVSLGNVAAGETVMAYFFLQASGETTVPQSYGITVQYADGSGAPQAPYIENFSFVAVEETISAQANKVDTVVSLPDTPVFGQEFSVTVTGRTGTIGLSQVLAFTPAAYANWPADALQLVDTEIAFSGGNTTTWDNWLVGTLPNPANTDYVATYTYRIDDSVPGPVPVSPVGYIASGTQMKHTDTGNFEELPPIEPPTLPDFIDLELTATASDTTPSEGTTTTVTVTVTNMAVPNQLAQVTATDVTVYPVIPAGLPLLEAVGTGYDSGTGIWTIGDLAVGASATIDFVLSVPFDAFDPATFVAEVRTASPPDLDSTPNNGVPSEDDWDSVVITPQEVPQIDLALSSTISNATPIDGDLFEITLTVSNAGGQTTATGVEVFAGMPFGQVLESVVPEGTVYHVETGLWEVGDLAPDEEKTITFIIRADYLGPAPAELPKFEAEVSAASPEDVDSTPNNGVTTEDDYTFQEVDPQALPVIDLELSASADPTNPEFGTQVTVTLDLINNDADLATTDASGVSVFVNVPEGLVIVPGAWTGDGSFDEGSQIWTVGALPLGGSASLNVVLAVPATGGPDFTVAAEVVTADQVDADSTPNTGDDGEDDYATVDVTAVEPDPMDLAVTVAVDNAWPLVGTDVVLTVTVENLSGVTATDADIYAYVPAGLLLLPTGWTAEPGTTFNPLSGIWTIPTLAVGGTATLTIGVHVPDKYEAGAGDDTLFWAEIQGANEPDSDYTNDYDEVLVTPSFIDLSLEVASDYYAPAPGRYVTLTYTLANITDQPGATDRYDATGVSVTHTIPAGLLVYEWTLPDGVTYNELEATFEGFDVPAGESVTFTLTLLVAEDAEPEFCSAPGQETNPDCFLVLEAEVTAAGESDWDSDPTNWDSNEDDYADVSLRPTSGGGDGGIESNATMASQLAQVLFDRRVRRAQAPMHDAPAPLVRTVVAGKSATASEMIRMLIPEEGPAVSRPYETSPSDLLPVTNADDIVAADFVRDADGRRMGAFFGALTTGELYEHTKVICDRLRGGTLGSVRRAQIAGRPFLMSRIEHENGAVDYAVSLNVFRTGAGFIVDSRFRLDEYGQPDSDEDVLNLQVWSVSREYTVRLAESVLARLEQLGPVTFANDATHAPAVPEVYVRTGRYEDGTLTLELYNGSGVDRVRLTGGSYALTERGERYTFERDIVLPAANARGIVEVELPIGPVFDATFFVETPDGGRDQMYLADGAWSYSFDGAGARVKNFDVDPAADASRQDGFFRLERAATLEGDVKTWAVLYRYLRPNGKPVDLTDFGYAEFTAAGQGQVRVLFEKASVTTSDHFGTVIRLTEEPKTYRLWFDELRRADGTGRLTAEDLSLVSFYVHGDQSREKPFTLQVSDLRFGGGEGDPLAVVPDAYELEQNYPNPFNPQTQIAFGMPNAGQVRLAVYDVLGREVATLLDGFLSEGRHAVTFDASHLPSGTYLYRLETAERTVTKTMTLLR